MQLPSPLCNSISMTFFLLGHPPCIVPLAGLAFTSWCHCSLGHLMRAKTKLHCNSLFICELSAFNDLFFFHAGWISLEAVVNYEVLMRWAFPRRRSCICNYRTKFFSEPMSFLTVHIAASIKLTKQELQQSNHVTHHQRHFTNVHHGRIAGQPGFHPCRPSDSY